MAGIKELEKIFKGLANKRRLAIIQFLIHKREASVSDIAEQINLSFKSTSRHLSALRHLDILDGRQESTLVFYRLSNPLHPLVKTVIKYIPNSRE